MLHIDSEETQVRLQTLNRKALVEVRDYVKEVRKHTLRMLANYGEHYTLEDRLRMASDAAQLHITIEGLELLVRHSYQKG